MTKKYMQNLTVYDFSRVENDEGQYYYMHLFQRGGESFELTLEPCFSGFCVAIYTLDHKLIAGKECTNLPEAGYYSVKALHKAIDMANKMLDIYDEVDEVVTAMQ